jgi:hypothetical protein
MDATKKITAAAVGHHIHLVLNWHDSRLVLTQHEAKELFIQLRTAIMALELCPDAEWFVAPWEPRAERSGDDLA